MKLKVIRQVYGASHPLYKPMWLLVLDQEPASMSIEEIRAANQSLSSNQKWVVADADSLSYIRRFKKERDCQKHAGQVVSVDTIQKHDPNWLRKYATQA